MTLTDEVIDEFDLAFSLANQWRGTMVRRSGGTPRVLTLLGRWRWRIRAEGRQDAPRLLSAYRGLLGMLVEAVRFPWE
jgi:hypothetical protein